MMSQMTRLGGLDRHSSDEVMTMTILSWSKMEVGYDSSDDKDSDYEPDDDEDSDDDPDEPLGRPRPPLIRRSDDGDDSILVKDVLEDDEALEEFEEEADVTQEPLGRGMRTRAPPVPYQASFRNKSYPGRSSL